MEAIIELYKKKEEDNFVMIQKALNRGGEMLCINDFVKASGFKLDEILPIDIMWNTFQRGIPIYITNELIAAFGYKGEIRKQKENVLRLVNACDNMNIVKMNNQQYQEFLREHEELAEFYPDFKALQCKGKLLHYFISFDDLKRLLLTVNTISGDFIKRYFISVEKLFFLYFKYQCEYNELCYREEVEKLYNFSHIKKHKQLLEIEKLDRIINERYRIGVVYFICEKNNHSVVKIGFTYNLQERLAELQIANARELMILNYHFSLFPEKEEKLLHEEFKNNLIRGEWFLIHNLKCGQFAAT
jgi:hypothetical protein